MHKRLTVGVIALMLVFLIFQPMIGLADDEHTDACSEQEYRHEFLCGFDERCEHDDCEACCGYAYIEPWPQCECDGECICEPWCGCGYHEPERPCYCDECECESWCWCGDPSECECDDCECEHWCRCDYQDEPWPQCECEDQDGLICCFYNLYDMIEIGNTELVFGADITVPHDKWLNLENISIDTGQHSLIVEGHLFVWQGSDIYGSGIDGAVLQIKSGGSLNIFNTQYNSTIKISAVEAGGIALSLYADSQHYSDETSFVLINANDGIGIQTEIPLELICHFISAGSGIGIVSTQEVSLFLCRVEGEAAAVDAPDIFADTSILIPQNDIVAVQRRIRSVFPNLAILDIGDAQPDGLFTDDYYTTVTYSAPGVEDRVLSQFIRAEIPQIDTAEPGYRYIMPVIEPWMELSGLPSITEELFTVAVRDLRVPVYWYTDAVFDPAFIFFRFNGDDESPLILWRSDNEGESWQDATDLYDFDAWGDGTLALIQWQEDNPVWLAWEAPDIGESEILIITFGEDGVDVNPGGDRSGIDRGTSVLPGDPDNPPGSIITPPPLYPDGSGQHESIFDETQASDEPPLYAGQITLPSYEPGVTHEDAPSLFSNDTMHQDMQADELPFDSPDAYIPLTFLADDQATVFYEDQPDDTRSVMILPPLVPMQEYQIPEITQPLAPAQPDMPVNSAPSNAASQQSDSFIPIIIASVLGSIIAGAFLILSAKSRGAG